MPSKLWEVMNDLEMVTVKICSAREIIDTAVDKLQEHQYDRAETLITAAYEFLGYYLDEFDTKFKLAWQETVVKEKEKENDALDAANKEKEYYEPSMPPWGHSDLEYLCHHSGSTVSSVQYTDEELDAMCDAAFKKDNVKKWILSVDDNYTITFPEDILKQVNWKAGDTLEWHDQGDGSFKLIKKEN